MKFENTEKALEHVLSKLLELEEKHGFQSEVRGASPEELNWKEHEELDPKLWKHVSIPMGECPVKDIFDLELEFAESGISFDTGAGFGFRDWELDWSFSYTPKDN